MVLLFAAIAKPNQCQEWDVVVIHFVTLAKPNHFTKPNHFDSMQGYLECREWDVMLLRFAALAKPNL
jgi:hypothetical protein